MRRSRSVSIALATALLAAVATAGPSGASALPGTATAPSTASADPASVRALALSAAAEGQLTGDPQDHQYFGDAVAVSGDTAVVGMPFERNYSGPGRVYVYVRYGTGWYQQAALTASDGARYDWFGAGVAISGDTVLVGAPHHDEGDVSDQGAVYVFTRSGTTWAQEATLTASDAAGLGAAVALSGDTAVVSGGGSSYVFTRSGTAWTQEAKIPAPAGSAGFGFSVALSGDTALVGAKSETVGGQEEQGAAYVFARSGTVWSQQARLLATDGAAGDNLGWSVALSGDTALVGAKSVPVGGSDRGAAYVFTRLGTSWSQQAELTDAAYADYAEFGYSVGLSGDTAVVGAPWDGGWGNPGAAVGSASVFTRSGTSWTQRIKLTAAAPAGGDRFGYAVALSGDTILVGAPYDDVGSNPSNIDQGSAYPFVLDRTQPTTIALTSGSTSTLVYGAAFAVRGTLRAEGAGLAGQRVVLQSAAPGASFRDTSLTASTTAGGAFTFAPRPTSKTYYRVRFAGSTGYVASGPTASVYALPQAWAGTPAAPSAMYRTRYYTVSGYLKPKHTAGTSPARIYKYRYASGAWRSYGYVTAKATNYSTYTKYSASVKLPYAGRWRLRAYAPADALHAAAWSSGYDYVTVR